MARVENLVGSLVQRWRLTKELGRGADGIVYAGELDGKEAAIKLFFPEVLERNGLAAARERLDLQLSLIGKKHHENLVEIYDGGEDSQLETIYIVMELILGISLDKLIGKIPSTNIPSLAAQLASAAKYLDENLQLVHRDIKPANIIISQDFKKLTLLDLGIIHQPFLGEDNGRLSGNEFVATLRYSPPEFVWRTEDTNSNDAWRAVTFYQIGATLHDMIMGKLLFSGNDTPRACLYDAVRDLTPEIKSDEIDGWLIQIVKACLIKNWRERLQFVSWSDFLAPPSIIDTQQQEKRIRLIQIRKEETRQAKARLTSARPEPSSDQQLWQLNNTLILEIRKYLMSTDIFPKFSVNEENTSQQKYTTRIVFDKDESRGFCSDIVYKLELSIDSTIVDATKLSFEASDNKKVIAMSTWKEMFSVETAFLICQQSFLETLESIVSD